MEQEPSETPRDPELGPPEGEGQDDGEERLLGTTELGRAASAFLMSLTRAARSFLLYDPTNEAIRHFLEAVQKNWESFFGTHGDLELKVRPFEFAVGPEVVYLDTDRERSLAFRLYRDGVRKVTLTAEVTWHEILKLLEVISVRYTGIRQTEDDMVVLLWKAGFQNIQVEAVEGVVEDEGVETQAGNDRSTGHYASVPDDFDLPAPAFRQPRKVVYQAIPDAYLAALVQEDGSTALPSMCVRLADELLSAADRPDDPLELDEIVPLLRELRDFLLAEGTLDPLVALVRRILKARLGNPRARTARDELAASFLDVRGLTRLLRSMPRDLPEAPPEMIQLLGEVPGDHLPTLFATLASERSEHVRRVGRQLIEHYVPSRYEWMLDIMPTLDEVNVCHLARAMARVHPERASDIVARLRDRTDPEVQAECLTILEGAPLSQPIARQITQFLASPHESVRVRTVGTLAARAVRPAWPLLLARIQKEGTRLSDFEAQALGEALVRLDSARTLETFREWTTPPRFYQYVPPAQKTLHWVAVAGLAMIPGDDAEKMVQSVAKQAEAQAQPDLQRHCVAAMVKRRRLARGPT